MCSSDLILGNEISHIIYLPSPESSNWSLGSQMQEICLARIKKPLHITVVGRGAFSNHEATPDDALVLGMLLSLKQEEPLISSSYVEMESSNAVSIQAFKESLGLIDGPYLIREDGSVCLQELTRISTFSESKINTDGCILITGGLGGMALTLAEQIRSETNALVILLHRNSAVHEAIPFVSYNCDVNDSARVKLVLAAIRAEERRVGKECRL